jgi:hypothetical protein
MKLHLRGRRDSSRSTACITRAVKFDATGASGRRESSSRNSFWIGSFFIVFLIKNHRPNKVARENSLAVG